MARWASRSTQTIHKKLKCQLGRGRTTNYLPACLSACLPWKKKKGKKRRRKAGRTVGTLLGQLFGRQVCDPPRPRRRLPLLGLGTARAHDGRGVLGASIGGSSGRVGIGLEVGAFPLHAADRVPRRRCRRHGRYGVVVRHGPAPYLGYILSFSFSLSLSFFSSHSKPTMPSLRNSHPTNLFDSFPSRRTLHPSPSFLQSSLTASVSNN